jgi:hypothetical protein
LEGFTPHLLPAPAVETVAFTPREAEEAAREPDVKGVGEVMPTILLAPVAMEGEEQGAAANTGNWGIGADASPFTGAGVRVAVLDTGIDASHAAFRGMRLICRHFSTGRADDEALATPPEGWDADCHGTHCAGTIFGRDVGPARIGMARGIGQALIGKALDDCGRGTTEMLFRALQWAIGERVDVISMSIGFDFAGLVEDRISMGWKPRQAASAALVEYGNNLRRFDRLMDMVRTRAQFNEGRQGSLGKSGAAPISRRRFRQDRPRAEKACYRRPRPFGWRMCASFVWQSRFRKRPTNSVRWRMTLVLTLVRFVWMPGQPSVRSRR